jgi:hypothetical protein
MYDYDLDSLNSKPFLEYVDPNNTEALLKLKKRRDASFKRFTIKNDLDDIFKLLGDHNQFKINYSSKYGAGWTDKRVGCDHKGYRTYGFRNVDFLNVLLGVHRDGTSVALCDNRQSIIRNIRIDFDFYNYSGDKAVHLAKEIQDKMAEVGMDVYFFSTGRRGIQAIIPFPYPLSLESCQQLWLQLRPYLVSNLAKLDCSSLEKYLRLPLGIHSLSKNISLFFSPETESYVSHFDQLKHFKNSWSWSYPLHMRDPIDVIGFYEQSQKGFTFIPKCVAAISLAQSQPKLTYKESWAKSIWNQGKALQPGQWQEFLFEKDAIHAAYVLFGSQACIKLEELAETIPANKVSDVRDRIKVVRAAWKNFNPIRPTKQDSDVLEQMLATRISQETLDEAKVTFDYIYRRKTNRIKWINEYAYDFILAVLHGINCSDCEQLTLSLDELIKYMHKSAISEMSRRTLVRIIKKATQSPPPTGVSFGLVLDDRKINPLAVFRYHPGFKIYDGASPGSFQRVGGLYKRAMAEDNGKNR